MKKYDDDSIYTSNKLRKKSIKKNQDSFKAFRVKERLYRVSKVIIAIEPCVTLEYF